LFSLLFTPCIYLLRTYAGPFNIFIIVVISSVFMTLIFKTRLTLAFNTIVISFGISYLTFFLGAFCISTIKVVFFPGIDNIPLYEIISVSFLEFFFIYAVLRTKRLKNGFPSLMKHGSSDIGMYLSISLMLAGSSFSMGQQFELVYIIPSIFILICGVSIIFWWRSRVTRKYIEDVKAREMEALQKTIRERDEEIERLRRHNEELAKIIHNDNKLIPAMELAVREYLMSAWNGGREAPSGKGRELLERLETVSRERAGIVKSYESMSKKLPSTDVLSVDSLMAYMLQRARAEKIEFDLSLSGSVKYLVGAIVAESDLNTLLADLIDNAIIASKRCEKRNILVSVGICGDYYRIDVYDSGEPFTDETILNLGLKRTTTHPDDGGSGIGLMTAFQILRKYGASFEIDDSICNSLYTKRVSACFDTLGQFRLKTNRPHFSGLLSGRHDIRLTGEGAAG
jgi:signal transduction histidine kinase